jgi:hypothetical protein
VNNPAPAQLQNAQPAKARFGWGAFALGAVTGVVAMTLAGIALAVLGEEAPVVVKTVSGERVPPPEKETDKEGVK